MTDVPTGGPEVVEPLDLPERPFTARNIADYVECPQKFLLSWFVPREETRRFLGGPATLHQALRQALIDCYRMGGPAAVSTDRVLAVFEEAFDGSACADSLEEERLHRQGVSMLRDYLERHDQESREVLDVDLRMEISLGDHRFVAVADLVIRENDGGINALRWMSARRPPSPGEIAESPGWGLLYACAEQHFAGEDVSVTMYSLRQRKGCRVRFRSDVLGGLLLRLTRVADRIRVATDFPPQPGQHCRWCRARSRCPALT